LRTGETNLEPFTGLSGYLVPKPVQDRVTAVSFGSNKWAHWKPADGSMILRVSMGRDGAPSDDLINTWDDEQLVQQVLDEVACHTGVSITAADHRVTRWPHSFPQYRPGHAKIVDKLEKSLLANAPGIHLAGASMRGIGIPACVSQANRAAEVTLRRLTGVL
jgi:oxygen-dependent protoporphyrinogen oxidase